MWIMCNSHYKWKISQKFNCEIMFALWFISKMDYYVGAVAMTIQNIEKYVWNNVKK